MVLSLLFWFAYNAETPVTPTEFRWNFKYYRHIFAYTTDQDRILHIPMQYICLGMCEIALWSVQSSSMMTPWNGNIFRVTGPLCGEFTGHRWIPLTKASDAELCWFLYVPRLNKRFSKHSRRRWFKTPSRSLWRHCNVNCCYDNRTRRPRTNTEAATRVPYCVIKSLQHI